jgi:hypothetical protein
LPGSAFARCGTEASVARPTDSITGLPGRIQPPHAADRLRDEDRDPGKVADFLRAAELEPAERAALNHGMTVRRGQGYTLRVSATRAVHRQLLARCQPLDGTRGVPVVPAQRKARRDYENRVSALAE